MLHPDSPLACFEIDPPVRRLTHRQERFIEEYLIDGVAGAAARRAGYSAGSAYATGSTLLTQPHIQAALKAARGRAVRDPMDEDTALEELARLAYANLLDYAVVGADGSFELDVRRLDRKAATAIKEVVIEERPAGRDGGVHRTVRFKLADKQQALVRLIGVLRKSQKEYWQTFADGQHEGRVEILDLSEAEFRRQRAERQRQVAR
ncbi:MAG: hypothetical protein JWR84_930 [Caulobacter sp.]|nr:hypothetical protein [Caulobacter sp.]